MGNGATVVLRICKEVLILSPLSSSSSGPISSKALVMEPQPCSSYTGTENSEKTSLARGRGETGSQAPGSVGLSPMIFFLSLDLYYFGPR